MVHRVNFRDLGISRVPLLAVAGKNGHVSGMWEGVLSDDDQTVVLRAVSSLGKA
jgi:hypothetical protein